MIRVKGLTFSYRRGQPILEDVDSAFESSRICALTGPSGRGKSTLLYLLGMLLAPDGGTIEIDGRDVVSLSDAERSWLRAHRLGFVFQDAALDTTRTVMDNVIEGALYTGMPRRRARHRAHALLHRFDVDLRADHRPGQVSGGQAQRVALCRALLNDPDVVLADEPTGNLDADSAARVLDAFRDVADDGATVIVATHDPGVVARCDHVLTL